MFLAFWSALSLIWTPFPGDAAARLGRTLLTAGIAMLAIVSLPERTKISNIYLLPIGVAITAAVDLADGSCSARIRFAEGPQAG